MRKFNDLSGFTFGKLRVINRVYLDKPKVYYNCVCACGKNVIVAACDLRRGHTTSCGCSRKRNITNNGREGRHTRLYAIYRSMLDRCYNPKHIGYKHYGNRGITVCDEWTDKAVIPNTYHSTKGWLSFREWALNHGYNSCLTIDRVDVNKGYEPFNCRWVTMKEQNRNKRNTHFLCYNGEKKSIAEWAEKLNIDKDVLYDRINKLHWDTEKALETKVKSK